MLFPPKEVEHLYPYGQLDRLHPNGLISYTDAPVRSDGLPYSVALKARVKALEQKIESMPTGKGKKKQNTKERQALLDAYEEALDELAKDALEGVNGVELEDVEDDFDALMADMEGDPDCDFEDGSLADLAAPGVEDDDEESEQEDGEDGGTFTGSKDEGGSGAESEPSSFSRIPTAYIHQHHKLPTTAVLPAGFVSDGFPDLLKASKPFVIELNAGEMLYLPASWWHEVTSFSTGDDENDVHMAFNYWFYPPDKLDRFEQPYEDTLVWDYFKSRERLAAATIESNDGHSGPQRREKRKAREDATRGYKRVKT